MIGRRTGFTLLELMLVLIVIGLAASMVLSTLPDRSGSLDSESERLLKVLQWVQQRAAEENQIYGVRIEAQGWQILLLQPNQASSPGWENQLITDSHWQLLYQRGKAVARLLSARFQLQVDMEQSQLQLNTGDKQQESLQPTLLFFPGGELTDFQITLTDLQQGNSVIIAVSPQGEMERRAASA